MLSNNAGFLARTTLLHFERIGQGIALFLAFFVIVGLTLFLKMPQGSSRSIPSRQTSDRIGKNRLETD
jgi:hypothetical protein